MQDQQRSRRSLSHAVRVPIAWGQSCRGAMRPIHAEPDARRGYIITHKCEVCGEIGRNRATRLREGEGEDDLALLIKLTAAQD